MPSTWARIEELAAGSPLLPNLQGLRFIWRSPESTEILFTVPPSLRLLDVRVRRSVDSLRNAGLSAEEHRQATLKTLYNAFSMTPNLTSLQLRTEGLDIDTMSSPIANMRHLQTITFDQSAMVSVPTLRLLSALPALKTAIFGQILWTTGSDLPFSGFRNLEELHIFNHGHPTNRNFYDVFSSPRLRNIQITKYTRSLSTSFQDTCHTWARRFHSLESIKCFLESELRGNEEQPQPISQAVRPLSNIPTLTQLCLVFEWNTSISQFTVSDRDITEIATAFPRLKKLILRASNRNPPIGPDIIGVGSLFLLASKCPFLEMLHLGRVDICHPTLAQTEQLVLKAPEHRLRNFRITYIAVDTADVTRAAGLIDRLFPHLITIPSSKERKLMDANNGAVWDSIAAYQTSRRECDIAQ